MNDTIKAGQLEGDAWKFWHETLNGAKYIMAPMVDMSELSFRMLVILKSQRTGRNHGVHLCYSPMFHAQRYINEDHYRKHFFTTCPEDRPLIVQFCANDVETFVAAAKLVEDQCDAVDLNLGCPQIIARKGHYGSFLQDEWELITDIVRRASQELRVPVTCKIRIHADPSRTIEYARMIEKAGCKLLAVHGRTREQKGQQTGLADWDILRQIRAAISIPMFANGNILSRDDADQCIQYTGVQGVMVAEGLLHNPALFADSHSHVCEMARRYIGYCEQYATDTGHMRTHLFRILAYSIERYPDLRTRLAESSKIVLYMEIIDELEAKLETDFAEEIAEYKLDPNWVKCVIEKKKSSLEKRIFIKNSNESIEISNSSSGSQTEKGIEPNERASASKRSISPNNAVREISKTKKICPGSWSIVERSAETWKDFPVWLCHVRARVVVKQGGGHGKVMEPSEERKEIFGLHLERTNGGPEEIVASEEVSTQKKQSKTERKLRQFERRVAGKKLKRQQKRDDRKERRADLMSQGVTLKKYSDEEHVAKKDRIALMKERVGRAMAEGQRVCIDMGLEQLMSPKELAKLAQQIGRLYGSNRKAEKPFCLCMTSLNRNGALYKECVRKNMGFDKYLIDKYEGSHVDVFRHDEIVYLSPDADEELDELSHDKVYIVGGLVDETVKKGRTTEAAQKASLKHAKLPLDKYMCKGDKGNYSKILTVNQVFDILLTYHNTGSWRDALGRHVPPRTGYILKDEVDVC